MVPGRLPIRRHLLAGREDGSRGDVAPGRHGTPRHDRVRGRERLRAVQRRRAGGQSPLRHCRHPHRGLPGARQLRSRRRLGLGDPRALGLHPLVLARAQRRQSPGRRRPQLLAPHERDVERRAPRRTGLLLHRRVQPRLRPAHRTRRRRGGGGRGLDGSHHRRARQRHRPHQRPTPDHRRYCRRARHGQHRRRPHRVQPACRLPRPRRHGRRQLRLHDHRWQRRLGHRHGDHHGQERQRPARCGERQLRCRA